MIFQLQTALNLRKCLGLAEHISSCPLKTSPILCSNGSNGIFNLLYFTKQTKWMLIHFCSTININECWQYNYCAIYLKKLTDSLCRLALWYIVSLEVIVCSVGVLSFFLTYCTCSVSEHFLFYHFYFYNHSSWFLKIGLVHDLVQDGLLYTF